MGITFVPPTTPGGWTELHQRQVVPPARAVLTSYMLEKLSGRPNLASNPGITLAMNVEVTVIWINDNIHRLELPPMIPNHVLDEIAAATGWPARHSTS